MKNKKNKLNAVLVLVSVLMFSFAGCDFSSDDGGSGGGGSDPGQVDPIDPIDPAGYAIGDIGPSGVGIVFYTTDRGLHGLEAAPSNQATDVAWSTITNGYVNGSSLLPSDIGAGSANTDAIINQNSGAASAAKLCRDYHGGGKTDWFLPSSSELFELYKQQDVVGGFVSYSDYWSSTEAIGLNSAICALCRSFNSVGGTITPKHHTNAVRAIRAF